MVVKYLIDGRPVIIPGVYTIGRVEESLADVPSAGRTAIILGQSTKGVPGSKIDLKKMRFTSFSDIQDAYGSGDIVDAARMLFTPQPSEEFAGRVDEIFVYDVGIKGLATRPLLANFGELSALQYGDEGNLIESQILDNAAEIKPSVTTSWLPTNEALVFEAAVNGVKSAAINVAADATADAVVAAFDAIAGVTASGGDVKTLRDAALDVTLTASGDSLILSKSAGAGFFDDASIEIGDIAYIDAASQLKGAGDENVGVYRVEAVSTTSLTLKQLKKLGAAGADNAEAFDLTAVTALAPADVKINAGIVISTDPALIKGVTQTLEIALDDADKKIGGLFLRDDAFSNLLGDETTAKATIEAADEAGDLKLTLSTGSFGKLKAGDLVRIGRDSLVAGATLKNVGVFSVISYTAREIVLEHLEGGTVEAVAAVLLDGANDTLEWTRHTFSTSIVPYAIKASADRKISVSAVIDGQDELLIEGIGGNRVMEVSYNNALATACTLVIDAERKLTITPTGGSLPEFQIPLGKFNTVRELCKFLSAQDNITARPVTNRAGGLPTTVLDMVDTTCLGLQDAKSAFNCVIKSDYFDFKFIMDENEKLVGFKEGTLAIKAGLPPVDPASSYLTGGDNGFVTDLSILEGLDVAARLKVSVTIPLFSRDAIEDINDGLTDDRSTYTIAGIHAAAKASIRAKSLGTNKRRGFMALSHYGEIEETLALRDDLNEPRVSFEFMLCETQAADGAIRRFLPWALNCHFYAGVLQAKKNVSMSNKQFAVTDVLHLGGGSIFKEAEELAFDFDKEEDLELAISNGMLVHSNENGRLITQDLTSYSAEFDPKSWFFERRMVIGILDDFRDGAETLLQIYIGKTTNAVTEDDIKVAMTKYIEQKVNEGNIISGSIQDIRKSGGKIDVKCSIVEPEEIEVIEVTVGAQRAQ